MASNQAGLGLKLGLVGVALAATLGGLFVLGGKLDAPPSDCAPNKTATEPSDAGEVVAAVPDAEVRGEPDAEVPTRRAVASAQPTPESARRPAEPTRTEPVRTEPVRTEPVRTEPVRAEHVRTETVRTEPVRTETVRTEPVRTEPVRTEPVRTEPVRTETARVEPVAREAPQKVVREPARTEARALTGDASPKLGGVDGGVPATRSASGSTSGAAREIAVVQRPKSEPVKTGELGDDEILEVVRAHEPALASCYEAKLKQSRRLTGRMVLHFDVTPSGQAVNFAFEGDSLKSPKIRDCILHRAREWRFPKFRGDSIRVAYPLYFRPVG